MIKQKTNNIFKFILYAIAFILVFYSLPNVIYDTDYMWHIKLGEYIYENKTIPTTNIFGYFDTLKFFSHEWLFDLVMYLFYNIADDNGVLVFVFLNVIFMIYMLDKILNLRVKNHIFNGFVLFITLGYMTPFIVARPQIFSYNLILYLIYLLINNFENLSKKFINLIIIVVLIVNAHAGSYPIVFAIIGIYILGQFIDKVLSYDKNKKFSFDLEFNIINWNKYVYDKYLKNAIQYVKKPIILTLLLIPFLLINPYTFDIYLYPFQVMANNNAMEFISEWQPTNFVDENRYLLIYIVFALSSFAYEKKYKCFTDWLFVVIFIILGATHIRHLSLLFLILAIFSSSYIYSILKLIYDKFINLIPTFIYESLENKLNFLINFISYITMLTVLLSLVLTVSNLNVAKYYPYEILNYIKENDIDLERNIMLNDYNIGGYLIRNDIKVFIDGRADVYSKSVNKKEEILGLYREITQGLNWKYNFDKYNIRYVLMDKSRPLVKIITNNSSFEVLKEDKNFIFAEYKFKE